MTDQPRPIAIDPLLTASLELGRDGLAIPPAFCRLFPREAA